MVKASGVVSPAPLDAAPPSSRRFSLDPSTPLSGAFDHAARLALVPRRYTTKGMFFATVTRHLSASELVRLGDLLQAPPRLGRYMPFSDYPLRDLYALSFEAARKLFPEVQPAEGMRRLAQRTLGTFGETLLGRVTLALVESPPAALMILPETVMRMQSAGSVTATRQVDSVTIRVRDYPYWVEGNVYGLIEGAIMHFGGVPRLDVDRFSNTDIDVTARWS